MKDFVHLLVKACCRECRSPTSIPSHPPAVQQEGILDSRDGNGFVSYMRTRFHRIPAAFYSALAQDVDHSAKKDIWSEGH